MIRFEKLAALCLIVTIVNSPMLHAEESDYGSFLSRLKLEDVADQYVDDGDHDPGHTEFRLLADYAFRTRSGEVYTVPKGSVVNGASIPAAVWSIVGGPWSGKYRNASVVHDHMCATTYRDSEYVHRVFYEAMLASGVGSAKAKLMYFAVLKGGPQWAQGTGFFPPKVTRGELTEQDLIDLKNELDSNDLSLEQIEQRAEW